jgi:catalase
LLGGKATFGRYQLQPVAGAKYITDDAAAKLAGPGDKLDDPSVAWPDSCQTAELGTVTLTRATTDETRGSSHELAIAGPAV